MNQAPSLNNAEIERIVRLVVQRLVREDATPSLATPATTVKPTAAPIGELRLDTRLVTLEALEGKLGQNIKTLRVSAKAVVTPAVRDELKERGIELRRADRAENTPNPKTPAVIVATKQSVSLDWTSGDTERASSLPNAVDQATARAKTDQMAVLLCDQPEVAACAANRQNGIRALVACGHGDWKAAVKVLGANLVVCDPRHWSNSDVRPLLASLWELRTSTGPNWIK